MDTLFDGAGDPRGDAGEAPSMPGVRSRYWPVLFVLALAAGAVMTVVNRMQVEPLPFERRSLIAQPMFDKGRVTLQAPGYSMAANLMAYNDELFAYLMFDYLRYRPSFNGLQFLLTFDDKAAGPPYRLMIVAPGDLRAALARIAGLEADGAVQRDSWRLLPDARAEAYRKQTELFVAAYNLPVRRKLEQLPRNARFDYLRRFIRFKSNTDPRIRLKLEPVPKPLSREEARHLAADIITVAEFYSLPLEFFVAIGAMENNYMNIRGDLSHSVWKKRAERDDIVLERRRGRVRILNDAAGVWQITRETLRYTHRLVQSDTRRDYCELPEHLRPPEVLDINNVSPKVLTTYAGLLLRDLLNRFDGDVTLAVSAYNGGPGRPNLKYGEGAEGAAMHARRVMEQAAALNGEEVMRTTWIRAH